MMLIDAETLTKTLQMPTLLTEVQKAINTRGEKQPDHPGNNATIFFSITINLLKFSSFKRAD